MGEKKQQLPRGVTIRKLKDRETLYISFMFRGHRCREPLSGLPVTAGNIRYAAGLLADIHNRIEKGTFDYTEQFPNSTRLKKLGYSATDKRVIDYLNEYIKTCVARGIALSTTTGYRGCLAGLAPLHDLTAKELTPARLKDWIIERNVTTKTIRNQMSVLRSAMEEAITEGIISINPCSQVTIGRYKSGFVE